MTPQRKIALGVAAWIVVITAAHMATNVDWKVLLNDRLRRRKPERLAVQHRRWSTSHQRSRSRLADQCGGAIAGGRQQRRPAWRQAVGVAG